MVEKGKKGRYYKIKCSCGQVEYHFVSDALPKRVCVPCTNCEKYNEIKKFWHRTRNKSTQASMTQFSTEYSRERIPTNAKSSKPTSNLRQRFNSRMVRSYPPYLNSFNNPINSFEVNNTMSENKMAELKNLENQINTDEIISNETPIFIIKEMDTLDANLANFQEEVMENVRKIVKSLECKMEQRQIILIKSGEILNKHITRARKGKITIPKDANPITNAATIIYAVLISNNNMPKISVNQLSILSGTSDEMVRYYYNKWYKNLAQRLDFNFKGAQLGESRNIISLYIFTLLINTELTLENLILQIHEFDLSKFVLRLRGIFARNVTDLTQNEVDLLSQLTDSELNIYNDMATNYSDVFNKYFTDLVQMIKLLIISIKAHKIIRADFSSAHFTRFLIDNKIDLFLAEETLLNVVRRIFNFLSATEYCNLFPSLTKTENTGNSRGNRTDRIRRDIVGNRIKLFVMRNIYNGEYFDKENNIPICLDCLREGFVFNFSTLSMRSFEFHHKDCSDKYSRYDSNELYALFTKNRGNPYFLRDLINQMEHESVVLKCGCHHILTHAPYFNYFKKIICWEDIPFEFSDINIFDLPADIIHVLIIICINNFYITAIKDEAEKNIIRLRLINGLKKKYIIDHIYNGVCPICGEFNTKDHLRVFEYNHLYKLSDLTTEEQNERKRNKIPQLYKTLSCSEIVREMEKRYHIGGYICRNCHFIIHNDISNIDEIFDDPNIIISIINNKTEITRKFTQNLIYSSEEIKYILKPEKEQYVILKNYLFALFEISNQKKENGEDIGVTRNDLMNYLGYKWYGGVLEKRSFLERYIKIVSGNRWSPTLYFLTPEGEKIVNLMYYFRDYYKNYCLDF